MKHGFAALADMPGMWNRSLIIQADGVRDSSSRVRWLQARTLFVDLRQSAALPDFPQLRCLNDLTFADCTQLARQQGFAGRLRFDGDCFEWLRLIDFQPASLSADAGRLRWENQTLIEAGRDVPYVEHWMRDPTVVTRPLAALRLRDVDAGLAGLAVQVGAVFMFARDRHRSLPAGASLNDCIGAATSLADARTMLDCEITLGSAAIGVGAADGSGSVILASTHPWRVSERLRLACTGSTVTTMDIDPTGRSMTRRWEIVESEGDPQAVWPSR
ncbi:MAG TPA: hypothetical protein VHW25_07340 [Steroidobacteraceae bacterium]|jgi:hypothetical protein|nr:hypothetical protein [Steroidobacteraceae bacterium]